MLKRILGFLERGERGADAPAEDDFDRLQVAAAALMVEASRLDADFSEKERGVVAKILQRRFEMPELKVQALIKVAEKAHDEVYSDWTFTNAIATGFSEDERAEVLSMLWEVAYADGSLHRFEEHMIKRVAGELNLTDAQCEDARLKAQEAGKEG